MSGKQRIEYINVIERQQFNLNDSILNLGELTLKSQSGFINTQVPNRVLNFQNNMLNAVTFELSLSLDVYERQVFSLLDILSDIGGLYGSLKVIFYIVITFFQWNGHHMYLMKDMFNAEEKSFKKMSQLERT